MRGAIEWPWCSTTLFSGKFVFVYILYEECIEVWCKVFFVCIDGGLLRVHFHTASALNVQVGVRCIVILVVQIRCMMYLISMNDETQLLNFVWHDDRRDWRLKVEGGEEAKKNERSEMELLTCMFPTVSLPFSIMNEQETQTTGSMHSHDALLMHNSRSTLNHISTRTV